MPRDKVTTSISSNAELSYVYDDGLHGGLAEESASFCIQRASSVEPAEDGTWCIDIYNGPIVFGFATRQEALAAEVEYLENVLLPTR